ncbi:MAG: sugar phosphate isomerase/epimerase [Verrucomicrobiota bacterium]|nr:sugar phosphate isomerase/epimerase [Verrucomicrobiota bacterium]
MRLLFSKSKWEAGHLSLDAFLARCAGDGFGASELYLPGQSETAVEIRAAHERAGLRLIAHIATAGATPAEHLHSLEAQFERAVACKPLMINAHTGKDYFSLKDNLRIFQRGEELADQAGITLAHETHRGRALFSAPATVAFLRELPELRLTADFSHWLCVHESDLSDQPEAMALAIGCTRHLHARVGFVEGPQIGDPRSPYFKDWVDISLNFWKRIVAARKSAGVEFMTITPEFGPIPYMPVNPADGLPVADAWEVNVWMKGFLQRELSGL